MKLERAVGAVIVINTAALLWGLFDHTHRDVAEHLESACLMFFTVELLVRLRRHNWHPWRFVAGSYWNGFDAALVVLALLPLGVNVTWLRVVRGARVLHSLRHVAVLRLHHFTGRSLAVLAAVLLAVTVLAMPAARADDDQVCEQLTFFTPDQVAAQLHQADPRFNDLWAPRTVWDAVIEQCD